MSEIYANLGNICGICVGEPPQSHPWGTLGDGELVGVALGGWWDWGWRVGGDGRWAGMAGRRDLARKVRESVSGLSKFTRPSTLTLLIRARSKKKKRPPARKGSAWGGR